MIQYLITAYDYTDDGALDRRLKIRPLHLAGASQLKATGNFIIGGAMLNDDGKMIGSTMILQFEHPDQLQAWQQNEPYITEKVWERVEVKPFRVAQV